jgi:hypothetical protein
MLPAGRLTMIPIAPSEECAHIDDGTLSADRCDGHSDQDSAVEIAIVGRDIADASSLADGLGILPSGHPKGLPSLSGHPDIG